MVRRVPAQVVSVAFVATMVIAASAGLRSQGAPAHASDPGVLTMALTGDSLMTRTFSSYKEPRFEQVVGLIRGADAAFTNFEMLLHDYEPFPMNESGGTWMRGDPAEPKTSSGPASTWSRAPTTTPVITVSKACG